MAHLVTLVSGDAPELGPGVQSLVAAAGADLRWVTPDPTDLDAVVQSIRHTKRALIGFQRGQRDDGGLPPSVSLRRALGIYAQERPIQTIAGLGARFADVDLLIVRETTEDVYTSLEHETIPDVFESLKVTTRDACARIARYAFEIARARGRRKVTIVHKANIMKLSDGLFLRVGREVAADYPDIACEDFIVDALCMRIVLDPSRFDVLVCGNLFGDIVADMSAGLVGGKSNTPSINIGPEGVVVVTAGHGTSDVVHGLENPLTLLLPAVHLLRHLGESAAADRLRTAISAELTEGVRPRALNGDADSGVFVAAVADRMNG